MTRLARIAILTLPLAMGGCFANATIADKSSSIRRLEALYPEVQRGLSEHCIGCHGDDGDLQAGLDLRRLVTILEGGQSGPAVVVGRVRDSLLFEMVATEEMPPDDVKLSPAEIDLIERWIDGS